MKGFNLTFMLILLVIMFVMTILYNRVRDVFISKLNKWVVIAITVILLLATLVLGGTFKLGSGKITVNEVVYYILMAAFLFSLNAFFDVLGWGGPRGGSSGSKKNKKIVIKPKAKPKRAKKK